MSRVTFNGKPGTTWTNDGPKVQYQLLVDWHNSCGLCAQYDHAVGPIWPTPFHRGCRCKQKPIWPGESAVPFVDFRAKIAELDRTQQSRVVGRANLDLIESGVLQWDDVVTSNRVRTLREVVSREKLSIDAMVKAGVQRGQAERTFEAVHTPAHQLAEDARRAALKHLADLGVGKAEVREHFGEAMASRVTIAAGPSQRPPGWNGGLFVGPKPPPLTPAAVAAALGVKLKPQAAGPTGKPVSDALEVKTAKLAEPINDARKAIDSVHGDGQLPTIPVHRATNTNIHGSYYRDENNTPQQILVSDQGDHPRLTTVHEVGHFLEHTAIPGDKTTDGIRDWSSDKRMAGWRKAVQESEAVKRLKSLQSVDTVEFIHPDGTPEDIWIKQTHVAYLLKEDEIWARSYAQYIASRANDPKLKAELANELKKMTRERLPYPKQWSEEDFKPIGRAIDGLFKELGWRS